MSPRTLREAASQADLEALRAQVEALTLRVASQEEDLRELRGEEGPADSPTIASSTSSGFEVLGDRSTTSTGPDPWSVREEVAQEVGAFIRRALSGRNRGASGRGRLLNLQNRIYLVARDFEGNLYDPVRVEERFYRVRALCQQGDDWGDSVFVGLPSQREAVLATRAAGLRWPDPER